MMKDTKIFFEKKDEEIMSMDQDKKSRYEEVKVEEFMMKQKITQKPNESFEI